MKQFNISQKDMSENDADMKLYQKGKREKYNNAWRQFCNNLF